MAFEGINIKLQLFIAFMMLTAAMICYWLPVWIYAIILLYLVTEFYILLGGVMEWLNRRSESDGFEETGTLRHVVAVDARLVFMLVFIGLWAIVTFPIGICKPDFPFLEIVFVAKLLLLGLVVHAIHTILMYERLAGMAFVQYPPLCRLIKRITMKIKEDFYNERHS